MGHGYKGDTGHHHSLTENLPALTSSYSLHNGYFGTPGSGRSFVREIVCRDPIKESKAFYDKAALGGIEKNLANGKGKYTKMSDGTILSFRETTSSKGSPAVEINIRESHSSGGVKYQKIHFRKDS